MAVAIIHSWHAMIFSGMIASYAIYIKMTAPRSPAHCRLL